MPSDAAATESSTLSRPGLEEAPCSDEANFRFGSEADIFIHMSAPHLPPRLARELVVLLLIQIRP